MVTHEPWHTDYVGRVITFKDGNIISDERKQKVGMDQEFSSKENT